MFRDFTLSLYSQLLDTIIQAGYNFYTFREYCEEKARGKYIILRHDVDLKAGNSLKTAEIEAKKGIRASYYFRVIPQSNRPEIIKKIAGLGHEIGYHYEDLSLMEGNQNKALVHFEKQLNYFRNFYDVVTICMHGSPLSGIDNRKIWESKGYRDYGITGEPYFDFLNRNDVVYFTDTARMWDGEKFNVRDKKIFSDTSINDLQIEKYSEMIHSTVDLMEWLKTSLNDKPVMITTHPQRWTDSYCEWTYELFFQSLKNIVKRNLIKRNNNKVVIS